MSTAKLEVVVAATEPLTVLPATDFPQIISACSLSSDTSGWLAAHVTVHSPALEASLHSRILTDSAGAGAPLSAAVESTSEVVEGSSEKESRDLPSASTAGTSQEEGCPTGSGADMDDGSGGMSGHSPAQKLQYLLIARCAATHCCFARLALSISPTFTAQLCRVSWNLCTSFSCSRALGTLAELWKVQRVHQQ